MADCNEVLFTEGEPVAVCIEEAGTPHSHDDQSPEQAISRGGARIFTSYDAYEVRDDGTIPAEPEKTLSFNVHLDFTVRIEAKPSELAAWVSDGMDHDEFFEGEAIDILVDSLSTTMSDARDKAVSRIVFSDISVEDVTKELQGT